MSEGAPEGQTGAGEGGGTGSGGQEQIDWKARYEALGGEDAEKWKTMSRRHEEDFKKADRERAKYATAAEELRRLKESGQSHEERLTSLNSAHESLQKDHQT